MSVGRAIARLRELRETTPEAEWALLSLELEVENARLLREQLHQARRPATADWLIDQLCDVTAVQLEPDARAVLKARLRQFIDGPPDAYSFGGHREVG